VIEFLEANSAIWADKENSNVPYRVPGSRSVLNQLKDNLTTNADPINYLRNNKPGWICTMSDLLKQFIEELSEEACHSITPETKNILITHLNMILEKTLLDKVQNLLTVFQSLNKLGLQADPTGTRFLPVYTEHASKIGF